MTPADEAFVEARIRAAIVWLQEQDARARAERWRALSFLSAGVGIAAAIASLAGTLGLPPCP